MTGPTRRSGPGGGRSDIASSTVNTVLTAQSSPRLAEDATFLVDEALLRLRAIEQAVSTAMFAGEVDVAFGAFLLSMAQHVRRHVEAVIVRDAVGVS